jgi:hypothetical protein
VVSTLPEPVSGRHYAGHVPYGEAAMLAFIRSLHTSSFMPILSPAYATASCVVSYLLTLRLICQFFAKEIEKGGAELLLVGMIGGIAFPFLWIFGMHLINFILRQMESKAVRIGFIVLSAAAILAWHGMPGLFAIGVGIYFTVYVYRTETKRWNDAHALEQFDTDGS